MNAFISGNPELSHLLGSVLNFCGAVVLAVGGFLFKRFVGDYDALKSEVHHLKNWAIKNSYQPLD